MSISVRCDNFDCVAFFKEHWVNLRDSLPKPALQRLSMALMMMTMMEVLLTTAMAWPGWLLKSPHCVWPTLHEMAAAQQCTAEEI